MTREITVRWEAADGYVGKGRPQSFKLFADWIDPDMSDLDLEKLLDESVQEDFEAKVTPKVDNWDEVMEWLKTERDAAKAVECT